MRIEKGRGELRAQWDERRSQRSVPIRVESLVSASALGCPPLIKMITRPGLGTLQFAKQFHDSFQDPTTFQKGRFY